MNHVHASAHLFVPSSSFAGFAGPADPLEILCGDPSGNSYSGFWLRLYSTKQQINVSAGAQLVSVAVPLDAWTHFELDVTYATVDAGSPSHMIVTVDGSKQVDVDTVEKRCALPQFTFNAGVSANGNFTVDVDDVIVDIE